MLKKLNGRSLRERQKRGLRFWRQLDRLIGVPLLWTLGKLRRPHSIPADIRRVVILQTAAIGDTILMSQGIRRLRKVLPNAHIVLALGRDNRAVAEVLPRSDEVVLIDVFAPIAALQALRALKPDVLIDYGTWPRINAVLTALAGARFTVGFKTPNQGRHFAYDYYAEHSLERHEVENQRELLGFLGATTDWDLSLEIPDSIVFRPPLPPESFVVFHAWASGTRKRLKEWPAEYWRELGVCVADKTSGIVLTGGPADASDTESLAQLVRTHVHNVPVIPVAGCYSLSQTACLLRTAKAVVSVNTGIMHLAALLGVPTIGLSGPSDPARWGPYGPQAVSLVPNQGTYGYLKLGFEYPPGGKPCLQYLWPAQVIAALSRWL
jgi:ADP-heptose:LPS heptosyltransferase